MQREITTVITTETMTELTTEITIEITTTERVEVQIAVFRLEKTLKRTQDHESKIPESDSQGQHF